MVIDREEVIYSNLHPVLIHTVIEFDVQGSPYKATSSRKQGTRKV
jgi:hypothetical protein